MRGNPESVIPRSGLTARMPSGAAAPGSGIFANLAANSQQTIRGIGQRIAALGADDRSRSLADALARLTAAVASVETFASPDDKQDVLDGIDALLDEASKPPAERRRGVFKPIVDSIAGVCGGAGGLAAVWDAVGPAIRAYFGL